jgi:hypothetical protein
VRSCDRKGSSRHSSEPVGLRLCPWPPIASSIAL